MRGCGRRCGGKNLPPHVLLIEHLSIRTHPHRVRQLLGERHGRRQARIPKPVGHGRPRGLRQAATPFLLEHRHRPHLLQHRQVNIKFQIYSVSMQLT